MSNEQIVHGMADLQKFLDELPVKLETNIMRGAMRAGAKVPLAEVRRTVPVDAAGKHPGALRDSARITTRSRRGVVKASVKVGGKSAFWAGWVEKGTAPHDIKPKRHASLFFAGLMRQVVRHPGAKPRHYMRDALRSSVAGILEAVGAYVRKRLTKEGLNVPGPDN